MSEDQPRTEFDLGERTTVPKTAAAAEEPAGAGKPLLPVSYEAEIPNAEGVDPYYFLRVLHKWRWTAITMFVLVVSGATLYAYTSVPVYEARVRVLIETERLNILRIEDIVDLNRSLDAQIAVLQSRWLAKKTMESLHLLGPSAGPVPPDVSRSPEPASSRSLDVRALWLAARSRGARLLRLPAPAPPPAVHFGEIEAENQRLDAFLSGLTVVSTTKGVLDLKYRSSDPVLAARSANGLAQEYIDQNLETRFSAIREVTDWLAARLGEQRQKVDSSEEALQRFREQNHMVVVEGIENPTLAKLNELTAAMTRAKAVRLEKEAVANRAQGLRADPAALGRLAQMLSDSVLQQTQQEVERLQRERAQMAEKLQDRHPDMIRIRANLQAARTKLQTELDRVVDSMREDVSMARSTESKLEAALEAQKQQALAADHKGLELGILQREAQSNRQIYDMLLQRARETNIAREIKPTQARILDAADVPQAPILPNTRQNLLIALLAGLMMAVGSAFGLEQLDNRVKTPDEIKTRLHLPLLGFVPEVRARTGSDGAPLMTNNAPSAFVEALRSIRTNVLYSIADESMKSLVITSASLSEGKTVVAGNLAIAIAQSGQRVLLIDADMRRPTLHQLFSLNRDPGLSNLLVGTVKASDVVQRSGIPNLWVMPSGLRPPNPPELLGSQRFKNMMAALSNHFDWILLDAPPIAPVTDACVIANHDIGVLFVVGAERTSRSVVRRALEQLGNVDARVIGGVLSRVDIERHRYYYSKYYHPRYGEYASLGSRNA
jgi:succinoglycan biosynthesis transport protein ExoP